MSTETTQQIYTPAQGARWMAKNGLPITLLNGKIVLLKGWQDSATHDPNLINTWAKDRPDCNYGCVFKKGEDGFWAVDEDVAGVIDRFTSETGIIIDTLHVQSSAGRYHWYFKASPESDELLKNITQAQFKDGAASVRVQNEYTVCPFSIHPEKKTAYLPSDVATPIKPAPVEFVKWLLDQQVQPQQNTKSAAQDEGPIPDGQRDVVLTSIAGRWREAGLEYEEIYTALPRVNQERCRPPKSDADVQRISNSVCRYPKGITGPTVLIPGKLPGEAVVNPTAGPEVSAEWQTVTALDDELSPVAPFKADFLPNAIQPWVVDVSERMSVSMDFAGICALATIAGVLGRRVFVYPKAMDKEWRESLALSGAVVASSGKTKTPTWKTFTNIVVEKESDWRQQHQKAAAKYLAELEAWTATDKTNREVEKKTGVMQNTPPVPVEPSPCRRLMLNDATPEKMHDVMKSSPEGLFYYRDELSSWVAELDKEGREVQRGLFLVAMNGDDAYSVDRIGRDGGHAIMCASVFGGFQPELLREFLNNSRNVDDGTIPRFPLLVWPDDVDLPIIDRPSNNQAKQQFRKVVRDLAEMTERQVAMHFSPEAQVIFDQWFVELNQKIKAENQSGKRSHLSKYKGGLPKIAALLQIVDLIGNGELSGNHQIDVAHLQKALGLLAYLESHMHRVYDCIQTPIQKAESAIAKHIKDGDLEDGLTVRSIQRRHWKDLSKPEYIDLALETLVEKGWLRELPLLQNQRGGRPTIRWEINPSLVEQTNPRPK